MGIVFYNYIIRLLKGVFDLAIFEMFGSLLGYVLWFFFDIFSSYGIAIALLCLLITIIMFPTAIKRQKNMASQARMTEKQNELMKKYGKDRQKYNEEMAKLYEKERFNPMSGCFITMLLPLVLLSGIYSVVQKPLTNTLHIPQEKVSQALVVFNDFAEEKNQPVINGVQEFQIVRNFKEIKPKLTMFNKDELSDIEEYSLGFDLFGIDLLKAPNECQFSQMLWLIPVLCFITTVISNYLLQKMSGANNQMPGCTKFMPYAMALLPLWISYGLPGAVGLYWIFNTVFNFIQGLILNKFYNVQTINAKNEAARFARLKLDEADIISEKNIED